MCSKESNQAYRYEGSYFKKMFKEASDCFSDMNICENCAKRESGKKLWTKVRRTKI